MLHYSRFFGLRCRNMRCFTCFTPTSTYFFLICYFYFCWRAPFPMCANATLCPEPITVRSDGFATAAAAAECTQLWLTLKCECFHGNFRFMDFLCKYSSRCNGLRRTVLAWVACLPALLAVLRHIICLKLTVRVTNSSIFVQLKRLWISGKIDLWT